MTYTKSEAETIIKQNKDKLIGLKMYPNTTNIYLKNIVIDDLKKESCEERFRVLCVSGDTLFKDIEDALREH